MNAHQKLLSISLMMLLMSLIVLPTSAQRKKSSKEADTKPVPDFQTDDTEAAAAVENLLQQTGLKYSSGKGVWIITRSGPNIGFFQLRLSHRSGTLVTQVIISKRRVSGGLGVAPNILRLTNKLDYVKVGLDSDDDWFIRNESRLKSLDVGEFKLNLDRVAEAADRIFLELQQSG